MPMNQCAFKHSARNLPFSDSMNALSVGPHPELAEGAWAAEVERHAAQIRPEVEFLRDELRPLIDRG